MKSCQATPNNRRTFGLKPKFGTSIAVGLSIVVMSLDSGHDPYWWGVVHDNIESIYEIT